MIRGPGWVKDQLDRIGLPVIVEESRGSFNLAYLRRLIRHLKEHEIDLVHAHLPGANLYGSMAGRICGIPVISTFHGSVDIRSQGRMEALKHYVVRRYSRVVAVSTALRDEVSQTLNLARDEVELIPNGIESSRFAAAEPLGLHAKFNISAGTMLIGSLGNIRPAKAYDVGLRMLRALLDAGVKAHWVIAGQARPGDALLGELQSLAAELGISDHVSFIGFVASPERFLTDLDVFLLCSSSEGHPLALTQAMAAGKPIVATCCGIEKVLDGEAHAWLAAVNDHPGLAAQVQALAADGGEARRRAVHAQEHARLFYDQAVVLSKYQGLYESLLDRAE